MLADGVGRFFAPEGELNFISNFLRDLPLKSQQAAQFAIILPRPEAGLVPHLDELRGNSYLVRVAPDAALQHVLHSQFTANLFQVRLAVLVVHDRSTRDDPEVLGIETSESGDHFLRHAVAEIILPGVSSEVLEGKNRQHRSSAQWLRASLGTGPLNVSTKCRQDNGDSEKNQPSPWGRHVQDMGMGGLFAGYVFSRRSLRGNSAFRDRWSVGIRHGRDKAVTLSRDGLYEKRPGRIVFEDLANLTDRSIDAVVRIQEYVLPQILCMIWSRVTSNPFCSMKRSSNSIGIRSSFS